MQRIAAGAGRERRIALATRTWVMVTSRFSTNENRVTLIDKRMLPERNLSACLSPVKCRFCCLTGLVGAAALLVFLSPAVASDYGAYDALVRGWKFGALASFTSNYFYRGYTKSDNRPTVRGNLDFEHDSGFYGGSWLSWIDFSDGEFSGHSDLEFYPYLGYTHELTDSIRAEVMVSRYLFNQDVFGKYSDYNEYSVAFHYRDLATVRVYFADDAYHRGNPITTWEISGRHPILDTLELSAGAGYNDAEKVLEYDSAYWHAGLTYYWEWLAVDVRYVDSHFFGAHETEGEAISRDQLILTAPDPKFVFSLNVGY